MRLFREAFFTVLIQWLSGLINHRWTCEQLDTLSNALKRDVEQVYTSGTISTISGTNYWYVAAKSPNSMVIALEP